MLPAAGCLVAPPPESGEPEKMPPVLDLAKAVPSVTEVRSVFKGDTQQESISVPVRSEDAGDDLIGVFYVNWNVPGLERKLEPPVKVLASTFDDDERTIRYAWDYSDESGCVQLTLLVTHYGNWDFFASKPLVDSDVALASWTFNVDDDPANPNLVRSCPTTAGGGV